MKFPDFLLINCHNKLFNPDEVNYKKRKKQSEKKDSLSVPLIKKEGIEPIKQNQINMLMGKLILSWN